MRIVTGLYQAVARDPRFHRKLYVIQTAKACCVISGSSNLTAEGLKSAGEFNLLVRLESGELPLRRLTSAFEHLWSNGTIPLSPELIRRAAI